MIKVNSFKDLIIWQKSMAFVTKVYEITKDFPREEVYSLTTQIRRSSISIPSNIAEGYQRMSQRDFRKFLRIAYGSSAELETQLEISKRLGYCSEEISNELIDSVREVQKMINAFTSKMKV